jgi:hypothetical protein
LIVPIGTVIGTLYGALSIEAAYAETLFHDIVPTATKRQVPRSRLTNLARSPIELTTPLTLADLTGFTGLQKARISRAGLIEVGPSHYTETVKWAEAAYETGRAGLAWMSRPAPDTVALLLFKDRLPAGSLVATSSDALPLAHGPGFAEALRVAHQADITIVEP